MIFYQIFKKSLKTLNKNYKRDIDSKGVEKIAPISQKKN